jgi:predicted RND superfamily exporter protein
MKMMKNKEILFANIAKHIIDNRWKYLIINFMIVVFAGFGLSKIQFDSSIENWFGKKSKQLFNNEKFSENFGNTDIVGIHLTTKDVFAPQTLQMLAKLTKALEQDVSYVDNIKSILNTEYTYAQDGEIITEPLLPDNPEGIELARKRILSKPYLKNNLVSDDFTETWIIINLLPYPKEDSSKLAPENLVGKQVLAVLQQPEFAGFNLRPVGTPLYNYEELVFTNKQSTRSIAITLLVLISFLALFYRSAKKVIIPMLTTIVSIVVVFGAMGYLGIKINAILFSVPIIFSLSVALGFSIHLINYYHLALKEKNSVKNALITAVAQWTWPTSFAVLTTIAALMSFLTIGLVPLNWLGLTSASLIFVVMINVYILTIILLSFDKGTYAKKSDGKHTFFNKIIAKIPSIVIQNKKKLAFFSLVFTLIMLAGLTHLEVNFDTEHSYGNKVSYINRMTAVAKTKIGTFDSYNITINFPEKNSAKKIDILKKFDAFQNQVKQLELTKKTSSLLTVLKDMNKLMNDDNPDSYRLPASNKQVSQLLMLYEMSGGSNLYQWTNSDFNILRLRVGLKTMNSKKSIEEIKLLRAYARELFPNATVNIVGSLPRLAEINRLISIGQTKSLLLAFAVISILMMIIFGNVKLGLIGLIPNIFPIIVIGGTMGFLDIPVDFLTVTVAPMILGIAVDDTIHFFNHSRELFKEYGNYEKTITETIHSLGSAIITTSLVIVLAFAVYLISPFNILRNLGLLIVVGILSALLADLFITPLMILLTKPYSKKQ